MTMTTKNKIARWVFTAAELKNPRECRADDIFVATITTEEDKRREAWTGVQVHRDGWVTDTFDDGTRGLGPEADEIKRLAAECESLEKPNSMGDPIADEWRNVIQTEDGAFVRFAAVGEAEAAAESADAIGAPGPYTMREFGNCIHVQDASGEDVCMVRVESAAYRTGKRSDDAETIERKRIGAAALRSRGEAFAVKLLAMLNGEPTPAANLRTVAENAAAWFRHEYRHASEDMPAEGHDLINTLDDMEPSSAPAPSREPGQYTPGPRTEWNYSKIGNNYDQYVIFDDTDGKSARIATGVEGEANAAAIVAVPDMLAVCEARVNEWHADSRNITRDEPDSVRLARAALSKARTGK